MLKGQSQRAVQPFAPMLGGPSTFAFSYMFSAFKTKNELKQTAKGKSLANVPCSDWRGADRKGGAGKMVGGGGGTTVSPIFKYFTYEWYDYL